MNKMYCFSCGGAISYGAVKPSFCSNCGTPLTEKARGSISEFHKETELENDDDGEHINWSKDDLSQQSLDIELMTPNVETFGEMSQVNYDEVGGLAPLEKREAPNISNKESLAQFKKEAGFKSTKKEQGKPSKKRTRKRKPK
jgi:hypothetical protein